MEIETLTRKWGNSIAIIIPSRIVDQEKIKENQEVIVKVEKKKVLLVKDVFGKFPQLRKWSAQELKDEARAGWLSKSDREREEEWKRKNK
jgi:antitoxin component of MazEF toxin-antitoxin module